MNSFRSLRSVRLGQAKEVFFTEGSELTAQLS